MRHGWIKTTRHGGRCRRCGTHMQYRRIPWTRRWYREYRLPDGTRIELHSYSEPKPPCLPADAPTEARP